MLLRRRLNSKSLRSIQHSASYLPSTPTLSTSTIVSSSNVQFAHYILIQNHCHSHYHLLYHHKHNKYLRYSTNTRIVITNHTINAQNSNHCQTHQQSPHYFISQPVQTAMMPLPNHPQKRNQKIKGFGMD